MVDVKVARIKTKKNKRVLYTVAIVLKKKGMKMLSYQGRYKTKAAAEKKRREILEIMGSKAGG